MNGGGDVLILAPHGRDASVICAMLFGDGITADIVPGTEAAAKRMDNAATLVVTIEALTGPAPGPLVRWIDGQPSWSDFPIILLTQRGGAGTQRAAALVDQLGNVTILERPLHPVTLVSAVRSAARARQRQKDTDSLFDQIHRGAEMLRESERRFRSMADSAPTLIWVTDETGDVVFANRYYEEMFGRSAAEMLGTGWHRVVHRDDLTAFVKTMFASLKAQRAFRAELRVYDREGQIRWLRCDVVPRIDEGRFVGYVGCNVDITETKLAADALEQRIHERTEEIEAANRQLVHEIEERGKVEAVLRQTQRLEAVGQLTSGVAHDFNNLLTVILGNLHFLDRELPDAGHKRRLSMMRIAAERGAQLTAQLLAFSRRQKLAPQSIDLNETVRGMRDLLQSTMGGSVRIETVLGRELWSALVDPTQLELVILNLAINARDAMEVGGSLTVETSNVILGPVDEPKPEEPAAGEYVMIAVSDTGTGMPDAVLAKVFEPFYTTKEPGKGSGLGLSQVLGFAKQSGGGVRIETRVGEGTSVKVYLPRSTQRARLPATSSETQRAVPRGGERQCVLVVDDDSAVRNVTCAMLTELGYAVLEAGSGGAALDIISRSPGINLALIDFAMPGMNGAELAREIRDRRPSMPILFVTGYADLTALKEVGEDLIIHKPFRNDDLARKLAQVLGEPDDDENVVPFRQGA